MSPRIANNNIGDMLRSIYDIDLSGIVDKTEKVDSVTSLPTPGTTGKIIFLTTDSHPYIDDGT